MMGLCYIGRKQALCTCMIKYLPLPVSNMTKCLPTSLPKWQLSRHSCSMPIAYGCRVCSFLILALQGALIDMVRHFWFSNHIFAIFTHHFNMINATQSESEQLRSKSNSQNASNSRNNQTKHRHMSPAIAPFHFLGYFNCFRFNHKITFITINFFFSIT